MWFPSLRKRFSVVVEIVQDGQLQGYRRVDCFSRSYWTKQLKGNARMARRWIQENIYN